MRGMMSKSIENSKKLAGYKAAEFVRDGMVLGLGTGSTVRYTILKLADMIKDEGIGITGIPTSLQTEKLAMDVGIPLATLKEHPEIDLCIDGADQIDPEFRMIKGGGGAHTREKIVAEASKEYIAVVDRTKVVDSLSRDVPVEVVEFSLGPVEKGLARIGGKPKFRDGFRTDNGNVILDTGFADMSKPEELEKLINCIPGVVENGIFSGVRPGIVIIGHDEKTEIMRR